MQLSLSIGQYQLLANIVLVLPSLGLANIHVLGNTMRGSMRIHKSKAYNKDGKDYFSWKVSIPPEHVETLGWEHGQELEAVVRKEGLLLRPAKEKDD